MVYISDIFRLFHLVEGNKNKKSSIQWYIFQTFFFTFPFGRRKWKHFNDVPIFDPLSFTWRLFVWHFLGSMTCLNHVIPSLNKIFVYIDCIQPIAYCSLRNRLVVKIYMSFLKRLIQIHKQIQLSITLWNILLILPLKMVNRTMATFAQIYLPYKMLWFFWVSKSAA